MTGEFVSSTLAGFVPFGGCWSVQLVSSANSALLGCSHVSIEVVHIACFSLLLLETRPGHLRTNVVLFQISVKYGDMQSLRL